MKHSRDPTREKEYVVQTLYDALMEDYCPFCLHLHWHWGIITLHVHETCMGPLHDLLFQFDSMVCTKVNVHTIRESVGVQVPTAFFWLFERYLFF